MGIPISTAIELFGAIAGLLGRGRLGRRAQLIAKNLRSVPGQADAFVRYRATVDRVEKELTDRGASPDEVLHLVLGGDVVAKITVREWRAGDKVNDLQRKPKKELKRLLLG